MAVIDGFQLIETIKDFTFREQGGIEILKEWRELAIICQVDIEIVSVSKENYRNYGSLPAHGFYGYVSLVMRDFISQPIKIQQSRQTLYYARNDSAIANWFNYLQQVRLQENFKGIETLVCFNTGLLGGSCVPKPCKSIPEFAFDEFPLREVLVKTFYGTQFKIEYSFWNLNDELDNCGNIVTPKSKQTDGDKDSGLPPNGTAPRSTNPSNPYADLPAITPENTAGIIPQTQLNNADNPNPDNAPVTKRWAFFQGQYKVGNSGCVSVTFGKSFEISPLDMTAAPRMNAGFPISDSCGGQLTQQRLIGATTGADYGEIGGDGSYNATYANSNTNPYVNY